MFTGKFWKDLFERSVRTFVQGLASYVTLMGLDVIKADLKTAAIGGLIAAGYAVITSLGAAFKEPELQSASFSHEVATPVEDTPGDHAADNPRFGDN